jgi:chromosome partitioning protein
MSGQSQASFYHAETTDVARCREIADTVESIISGLRVDCFLSENGRQVVFRCVHTSSLTRSSATVLIRQFLRTHLDAASDVDYGSLRAVVFANEKGGVAKTSSCLNVATCLAMLGRRVLLIDLDAQANATLGLGWQAVRPSSQPEKLLSEPMFPLQSAIVRTDTPNLDLVPAGPTLHDANSALVSSVGRELKLRTKLVRYVDMPGAEAYDYVMIDSPPAADLLTLNALMAATHLVVPVQASYYSLSAMSRLSATVDSLYDALDPKIELLGILVTMYNGDLPAQRAVLELLHERISREFGPFVFATTIDQCDSINESEAAQRPVVITHPDSTAAHAYRKLTDEILDRVEGRGAAAAPTHRANIVSPSSAQQGIH